MSFSSTAACGSAPGGRVYRFKEGAVVPTYEKGTAAGSSPRCVPLSSRLEMKMETETEKNELSVLIGEIFKRDQTALLTAIVTFSPLAVIVWDDNGCVRAWNPAAERIFGWSEQEILGKALPTIPREKQREFEEINAAVRQGETVVIKRTQWLNKNGAAVDVHLSVAPVTGEYGRVEGRFGILADISDHLRREEKLQESEEKYRVILENMEEG